MEYIYTLSEFDSVHLSILNNCYINLLLPFTNVML